MTISKLCDRTQPIAPSQKGFLNFLVLPIFEYLGKFLNNEMFDENCLANVISNIKYWEKEIETEVFFPQFIDKNRMLKVQNLWKIQMLTLRI